MPSQTPQTRGVLDRLAFRALRGALRVGFRLLFGLRVHGRVPRHGPIVVVANHSSFLDAFLLGMTCRARLRFVMTELYASMPYCGWFFRWQGVILVREQGSNTVMLREGLRALARREVLAIFPEGQISRDGKLQDLQPGALALAARTGAPIVPVGIRGAYRALPRHARWPRLRRIDIQVGEPVTVAELLERHASSRAELTQGERLGLAATELREQIRALLEPGSSSS